MFLPTLLIFTAIQVAVRGQTITPVYVQSNAPVTLTCPADDQATTLTWTGPGGIPYVTGTTVEAGLAISITPRISTRHTGGSYTLSFTEFRSSDTGIYTCTVDGTVDTQMVIVQGMTSASPVYTRQGGTVTLQCSDTGGSTSWSVTSTTLLYIIGTVINPAIPDDTRTRLSVTRQDGTYNIQISDVQLSDVREYRCSIGVTDTYYHLLLHIPPSFPEIENTVSVEGQNRTTGTEDGSMTLTCNSRGGTPAASVSWIKDGTILVTSDNTVQHTKVFTRADDRTVYTCQSSSPALISHQTTSVLVYLYLKPGQPTISGQLSQTGNTNLQVICLSTGSRPAAILQWKVGGTLLSNYPTDVKAKDSATYSYTVTSTLSLPVTRQDNGKSVYCRASNQALSGGIESVRHSITALFGPDSVTITGNRVIVADGSSTNTLPLTCTTQEFSRHIYITWYNGTTQIPNTAGVTNTSGTYGGSVSIQVLHLKPDRYQDGNVIKCVVQNEDVTLGEKTASVTLNINYPPSTPVSVSVNPTTEGPESATVDLTCHVTGGKPTPSLQWTCPASVSKTPPITGGQGDSSISLITVTLTRQANGKRCNCIGSQTDATWTGSDQSPVFAVRFGPDSVSITGNRVVVADGTNTLPLTCTTQEYNTHVHITWYNGTTQIPNTAIITNTSGTYGGYISTQVLQLTPDRYQDGNVIKCVVHNEDVTLGEKTAYVTLNINYPPSTPVSVSVNPTTEGRESATVDLTCHVTGGKPTPSLQWTCPASVTKTSPITGGEGDSHTSMITVTLTRQANEKRCNCTGRQTDTTWTGSDVSPVFAVRFGPDSGSITGNRVVVANGTNTLSLTCTTQEYNRHVHITWYNDTTRIPNTVDVTNASGTYGGFVSAQVLQLTPDRYQNGNVIKCVVQNEDVTIGEKTASVTLRINYRPYLTLTPTPGVNVIEGGELEIRCDMDSNPSPSSITWSRVGGQLPSNSDVTSGVIRIPSTHRTDRGTYQCTAENSVSREQDSLTIDIYYPPDIQVTYTNTTFTSPDRLLSCVPDGNPDTYQFGQWRHIADDGTEIRQLTGSSSPLQSVLTLPDPGVTRRYEDTGYYICKVSNGIPVPSSYRSSSVFFVVEAPPVVIANTKVVKGQIGGNATMEVEFYSRPAVSSSDVFWTRGSDGLRPLNKYVTSVDTRLIRTSFHGVDIKVKGYVAAIKLPDLVEQDFGNYTVTMENSIGMNNFTIWFKSASPPLPPEKLAPLTHDSRSITLEWTPSFNGGAEQEFVIGYKSDVSEDFVDLAPIPDIHESTQSYQITGLKSGTIHFARIYSENEIGRSGVVFLNQTTAGTHADRQRNQESRQSTYQDLDLTNITPPPIYADLHTRDDSHTPTTDRCDYQNVDNTCSSQPYANINPSESRLMESERCDYQNVDNTCSSQPYANISPSESRLMEPESGSTYETLGQKSEPSVYDDLSKKTRQTYSPYVNTTIKQH